MKQLLACCALTVLALPSVAASQTDPEVVTKIIEEGTTNSQVWVHLDYLSEHIGTRLTGSTRLWRANSWTRDQFASWGLTARLDKWGEIPVGFDRGPSFMRMVEPERRDFEFTTQAWTAGTDGTMRGRVLKAPLDEEQFEAIKDDLEDAWVLSIGSSRGRRRGVVREDRIPPVSEEMEQKLREAGIAGMIVASSSDLVRTFGARGWRDLDYANLPTDIKVYVRRIDYDAMNSRLADGEEVEVELSLSNNFVEGPIPLYNTIAEIRGTDFPDEVVIISGHLDSWDGPGSMGTQDNGTGSSVTLEAARILAAVGVKPRRTIRFILWTGEEQGLLGSRAYLEKLSDEQRAKISAVFVDDGGTNYEGGLQIIGAMAPMLEEAVAPSNDAFPDMPVELRIRERLSRFGGSDHAPFVRAGIPAFFWDEKGSGGREGKNYRFIHHTQHDTPRYAVEEYLVQSATNAALVAYSLGMADTLLPREPEEREAPAVADATPEPREAWELTQGPLSGAWEAYPVMDGQEMRERGFDLDFETHVDGRVRGGIKSRMGEGYLSNVVYNAETGALRFTFKSEAMNVMSFNATVKGEEMEGTLGVEGQFSIPFKAKKTAPEEQPAEPEPVAAAEESPAPAADEAAVAVAPTGETKPAPADDADDETTATSEGGSR